MKQSVTQAIVLARTNYQDADKILTLLTPHMGKVRLMARGVRKSKSKMAGGIELFSVSEIGFIQGRGELHTLTSARLVRHYEAIVQNIDRTMLGYELIKRLNKVTEEQTEPEYFDLLIQTFEALNDHKIELDLISLWFNAQLLKIAGHSPNLHHDVSGGILKTAENYIFSFDDMAFIAHTGGAYQADHIKFLRLVFSGNRPVILQQVQGVQDLTKLSLQLVQTILPNHIRA